MKNFTTYPKIAFAFLFLSFSNYVSSQTNVFDDIIVPSPNHTYLELALIQENLDVALQNSSAQLTVFAPDDNAFTNLAASLNVTVPDLLALPNLTDILTYHVLGVNVSASTIKIMVVGRILQGIGLSASRSISIAMIRDRFEGDYMAKIMSFVVTIFILVPIIAPTLGKLLLDNYGWESIFYSQLFFGIFVLIWFWKRQPETLPLAYKKKFSKAIFISGTNEFIKHKSAVIFTLISGLVTGSFMVFLSTSQHIFEIQYGLVDQFPYIFGALAFSVGIATFTNGTLVVKFGMRRLVNVFILLFTLTSLLYIVIFQGILNPSISILVCFLALQFFSVGFLFGNVRSLAMQPIGHIAGIGAAINGFVSTIMAVPIATFIGGYVDTTALPLFIGFAACGLGSLLLLLLVKKPIY